MRDLIYTARSRRPSVAHDPLIHYLVDEPPGEGTHGSTVQTLDKDLYG